MARRSKADQVIPATMPAIVKGVVTIGDPSIQDPVQARVDAAVAEHNAAVRRELEARIAKAKR